MPAEMITIEVDSEAARAYKSAPVESQKKIQALLNLWLRDLVAAEPASLKETMTRISRKAANRGLTSETLAELLKEA